MSTSCRHTSCKTSISYWSILSYLSETRCLLILSRKRRVKFLQVVKGIWHKAASPRHMDGSVVFARWRQCAPYIQKAKKWLPRQRPLRCEVSAISEICRPTTQTPLHNQLPIVAIVLTKPVIAILIPKLVAVATYLSTCGFPSNTWFLGPIRAHNPNGISIGSAVLHRWPQSVPILYHGTLFSPSKLPFPYGGSGPI